MERRTQSPYTARAASGRAIASLWKAIPPRALLLALYPFILTSALELHASPQSGLLIRLIVGGIYNIAFFSLLLFLIGGIRNARVRQLASGSLWAFLLAFTFLSVYHFFIYGQLPGLASFLAIMDTTGQESSEFIQSVFRIDFFLLSVVAACPLAWAIKSSPLRKEPALPSKKLSYGIVLMLLGLLTYGGVSKSFLSNNNPLLFTCLTITEAVSQKAAVKKAYSILAPRTDAVPLLRQSGPATHILVIGESTTSRHMSLYGYGRMTSPELQELRQEINIAEDACSSRGTTVPALQEMLTFASRKDHAPLFTGPNLLQIMKAGGFRTYWLSNQQAFGYSDTWSGLFAASADVSVFVNKRGWTDGVSFDEKLLATLRDSLDDSANKKFIIVHLLGAHIAYDLRYPAGFARFRDGVGMPATILATHSVLDRFLPTSAFNAYNAYDNAVLYNDHILSTILKYALGSGTGTTTLTYISDHGEALGETSQFKGHVDGPAPRQVYEVPLLFYLSPKAKDDLPDGLDTFLRNLQKPFESDQLIHTMLDLYGLDYPMEKRNDSLLRTSFTPITRYCDGLAK